MKTYSKPLLLFVSLALALIACAPVVTPDAASSVSPVPATATAVPATATAAPATATSEPPTETPAGVAAPTLAPTPLGPQTYRQEAAGFELDYPAGWISDLSGISDGVILWSSNPPAIGADGVPAGLTKIDVVGMPGVTQTLDEVLQDQRDSILNSNGTILEEQRFVLPSGLEAVRLSISGFGGDTAALLSIVNGHPVFIAAYGDKESFDAIAQSLRPIAGIPH
jgi:hypothetical protein